MSARSQELVAQFEQTNGEIVAVVESCTPEEWRMICAEEQWPVGVTAHHVAEFHLVIKGWVETVVAGQPLTITYDEIDAINARHREEHPDPTQAETLALLRANAATVSAYITALSDDELDREAPVAIFADVDYNAQTLIEAVQIFHIIGHLDSIKATLGRAEATSSLSFMQPHAV
jgi:hypothetical protein